MRLSLLAAIIVVFAIAAAPTAAQPRVADQREFDLLQQATTEPKPIERLATLWEWEASYPNSELRRERMLLFSLAYKETGQAANSLAYAMQVLKLDARDIQASIVIAQIGPALEAPSVDQVKAVEDAAISILSQAPELARAATAAPIQPQAAAPQANDPETQRVSKLIQEWRRSKPIKTAEDVENEFRAIAEPALAWARKSK